MGHAFHVAEKSPSRSPGRTSSHAPMIMRRPAPASRDILQPKADRCACGGSCPRCQAKSSLKIGAPDDAYEREADAVADKVMRMAGGAGPIAPAVSGLQHKCAACEKEDEEQLLQPKTESSSASAQGDVATAPSSVDSALSSPGQPLDFNTRAFFESRFGHDFSGVRVHSDSAAARSARYVSALAYTVGHDIVFGAGRLAPGTNEGRRLIAHELTHVVQQSGSDGLRAHESNEKRGLSPVSPPVSPAGLWLLAHELTHVVQQTGEASAGVSPRLQRAGDADQPPAQEPLPQDFDVEREEPFPPEALAPESGTVPPGSPSFEVLSDFVSRSAYRTEVAFKRSLISWARKYLEGNQRRSFLAWLEGFWGRDLFEQCTARAARAREFNQANEAICMGGKCTYDFATRIFLRIDPDGVGWKVTFVYDTEERVPAECEIDIAGGDTSPYVAYRHDEAGFGIEIRYLDPARRAYLDQLQAANTNPACLGERGEVIMRGKHPRRAHELLDK